MGQETRLILCSTGTLERLCWSEVAVKSHKEWSKWWKDFHPQLYPAQTIQLARGKRDVPRGTPNNKDFTSAAHHETKSLPEKEKQNQSCCWEASSGDESPNHHVAMVHKSCEMPQSGRWPMFRGALPCPHHAGLGQTNPKASPSYSNTWVEAEVLHQPGTCYCEGPARNCVFCNDFLQIGFSLWSESHLLEAIANYTRVPWREDAQQNERFGGKFSHIVPPTIPPVDIFQQDRLKSSSSDFSKSFGSAQSCESAVYVLAN